MGQFMILNGGIGKIKNKEIKWLTGDILHRIFGMIAIY